MGNAEYMGSLSKSFVASTALLRKMATDIAREESFRTSLRNQRRRLSATERSPSIPDIGLTKPSTPDIRLEFWDMDELSPLSTPAGSPPRSPGPYELAPRCISRSPSPFSIRSPIPSSSPLLCPNTASPALKRVKSFNKELRRARSFRAAREKSSSRKNSAVNSRNPSPCKGIDNEKASDQNQEASFSIKRALGSRKGWKILAEDGNSIDGSALRTVVGMIKDMETQGFAVPERISIRMP